MIIIIDYGMGNLRSAQKGIERGGFEAEISDDPSALGRATGVVLPGVGAFKDCYDGLCERGFTQPLLDYVKTGRPLLGICVGMQLLFEEGEEGEGSPGLGLLPGRVVRFPDAADTGLKVPHMGWNTLKRRTVRPCPLLKHCSPEPFVYFVHSYRPIPADENDVYATTEYGVEFASLVGRDAVFGVQFHPEKSQGEGIAVLRAFGEFVSQAARSVTL
jgi:glutamine amidotransferase